MVPNIAKCLLVCWAVVCVAFGASSCASAEEHRSRTSAFFGDLHALKTDALAFVRAPAGWGTRDWGGVALVAGAVGGLLLLDDDIRSEVRDHRSSFTRDLAAVVGGGGDHLGWGRAIVAATYMEGLFARSAPVRETGLRMAEATLFSDVIVASLKFAVKRSRPDANRGSGTYHPFAGWKRDGRQSFPSHHTSFAFSLATVSSERIGRGFGWIGYPLAGLVGLSRIHDDRHWASDVLAGAAIGTATGLWVARRGRKENGVCGVTPIPMAPGTEVGIVVANSL